MLSAMETLAYQDAAAMLAWQVELGADEAVLDTPVNRFDLPQNLSRGAGAAPSVPGDAKASAPAAPRPQAPPPDPQATSDAAIAAAEAAAGAATTLEELRAAMAAFDLCDLKRGARNLVFSDGNPAARVMIVGEAPGRQEDLDAKPFVGAAGQLLDKMFDAIGLARTSPDADAALYITNVLPWRPPQNRDPKPEEMSMMVPFLKRHIALADPQIVVMMGNFACLGLIGQRGITRLRGKWTDVMDRPALPMCHPAYLLRQPAEKAKAWADLLALKARLAAVRGAAK